MKTISIKQPYASLICTGIKDIENRTWQCPKKFIGHRVLIHASAYKKLDHMSLDMIYTEAQIEDLHSRYTENELCRQTFDHSAIIGSVEIADCVLNHQSIWADEWLTKRYHAFGTMMSYEIQPYHWVLRNPILFDKPILNVKGKLRFWDYPSKQCDINCLYGCTESFTKMPDCVNKTRSQKLIIVLIAVLLLCSTISLTGCTTKKVSAIPYSEQYFYA